MDHSLQKQPSAKRALPARRALSAAARSAADAALCRRIAALHCFRNARTLLAYVAFGGEADLSALLAEAVRQGKTVAYPICGAGFTLTAAVPGPDGWEVGAYGIRTPIPERAQLLPPEALDLVLVPCTAFDAACRRVGMEKATMTATCPAAGMPYCLALPLRRSGWSRPLWTRTTSGWTDL